MTLVSIAGGGAMWKLMDTHVSSGTTIAEYTNANPHDHPMNGRHRDVKGSALAASTLLISSWPMSSVWMLAARSAAAFSRTLASGSHLDRPVLIRSAIALIGSSPTLFPQTLSRLF